jgi:hypothetical protein
MFSLYKMVEERLVKMTIPSVRVLRALVKVARA